MRSIAFALLAALALSGVACTGTRHGLAQFVPNPGAQPVVSDDTFALVPIPDYNGGELVQFYEGYYHVVAATKADGPMYYLEPKDRRVLAPRMARHSVVTYHGSIFEVRVAKNGGGLDAHFALFPLPAPNGIPIPSSDTFVLSPIKKSRGTVGDVVEFERRLFRVEPTPSTTGAVEFIMTPTVREWGSAPIPDHKIVRYRGQLLEVRGIKNRNASDPSYVLSVIQISSPNGPPSPHVGPVLGAPVAPLGQSPPNSPSNNGGGARLGNPEPLDDALPPGVESTPLPGGNRPPPKAAPKEPGRLPPGVDPSRIAGLTPSKAVTTAGKR